MRPSTKLRRGRHNSIVHHCTRWTLISASSLLYRESRGQLLQDESMQGIAYTSVECVYESTAPCSLRGGFGLILERCRHWRHEWLGLLFSMPQQAPAACAFQASPDMLSRIRQHLWSCRRPSQLGALRQRILPGSHCPKAVQAAQEVEWAWQLTAP